MERISQPLQAIEKAQGQNSLSVHSKKNWNLAPDQQEVLEVKYKAKPFAAMSDGEVSKWAKALLVKIHVITGWVIPENELMNILVDQFRKKLVESYPTVNPEEIEYAFRKYGTVVKDWGKNMNLSLIDEVMIPYLDARFEVSKVEEQKKMKMLDAPKDEPLSEQMFQDWFDTTCADYKSGKISSIQFLPPMVADWLIKNGRIDHQQFFKRAAIIIGKKLAKDSETNKLQRMDYQDFKQQYENAVNKGEPFTGHWPAKIERLAKQIALNNYIIETQQQNQQS